MSQGKSNQNKNLSKISFTKKFLYVPTTRENDCCGKIICASSIIYIITVDNPKTFASFVHFSYISLFSAFDIS